MGRRPRVHFDGAWFHAIVRGNNRKRLFFGDADRRYFLKLVDDGVERFGHEVHAYCLMSNHAHFAIRVGPTALDTVFHNLCSRYSRTIHRRLNRSGHLFERRYRAKLIETDDSLARLVRYIHANPVEAQLVVDPEDYLWSSYRAYSGSEIPSWLSTDLASALELGRSDLLGEATRGLLPDACAAPAGREAQVPAQRVTDLEELLDAVTRVTGIQLSEMQSRDMSARVSRARLLAAVTVRDYTCHSLTALAQKLGRDQSSLSCLASRWSRRLGEDRLGELARPVLVELAERES